MWHRTPAQLAARPFSVKPQLFADDPPFYQLLTSANQDHPSASSSSSSSLTFTDSYLHVYVHAASAVGVAKDSILTLSSTSRSGQVTCPLCYSGKKQDSEVRNCFHAEFLKRVIAVGLNGTLDPRATGDALRFQAVLSMDLSEPGDTRFDVDKGHWVGTSLSSQNEDSNYTRLGTAPVNVEYSISEIEAGHCNVGGPADQARDFSTALVCIEPIPSFEPPLSTTTGCAYATADRPDGYSARETDARGHQHPHGKAHFLTHSRSTEVFVRLCSCNHRECDALYTGRNDGIHL